MVAKQQCQKPANQPTLEAVSSTTCFCSNPIHQYNFLNQACAGLWPARTWFLKIDPVRMSVCVFVCVFVCVSAPEAINN